MGLDMIKEVHADQSVLALKSFEALAKVADGQATKLIIPSELTNVANIVASIKEAATLDKA